MEETKRLMLDNGWLCLTGLGFKVMVSSIRMVHSSDLQPSCQICSKLSCLPSRD